MSHVVTRLAVADPSASMATSGEVPEGGAAVLARRLTKAHVGAMPGAARVRSPFLPVSSVTSETTLTEAIARVVGAVASLSSAKAA